MRNKKVLSILSDEECVRIYETTIIILEKKGVRFTQREALGIFKDAGLTVVDDIVFFRKNDIEKARSTIPPCFTRKGVN